MDIRWSVKVRDVAGFILTSVAALLIFSAPASARQWSPERSSVIKRVCHGGDRFVAVGRYGDVVWSTDGTSWWGGHAATTGPYEQLNSVCFGNNQFVATGRHGKIAASPDGVNWTEITSPVTAELFDVAWGGGRYTAVGEGGTVITSPDGISWSVVVETFLPAANLTGVAYGNGTWVATSWSDAIVSADGLTWTAVHTGAGHGENITYANGRFIIAGGGSAGATVSTSGDGKIWQVGPSPDDLYGVVFNAGTYVALGQTGTLYRSINLATWSSAAEAPGGGAITFGKGIFCVVGSARATSADGVQWQVSNPAAAPVLSGACWFQSNFIVVGDGGYVATYDWKTGLRTSQVSNVTQPLNDVATDGTTCVAVGIFGTIIASRDGVSWSDVSPNKTGIYDRVEYALGRFYATSGDGTIATSVDGFNWQVGKPLGSNVRVSWWGIASDGITVWVVGSDNRVMSSINGTTWTSVANAPATFYDIAYGNGRFVGMSIFNGCYTSTNGVTWSAAASALPDNLAGIRFAGGRFTLLAGAQYARIYRSADGVTWSQDATGVEEGVFLKRAAYGDGVTLALTDYGGILRSARDLMPGTKPEFRFEPQRRFSIQAPFQKIQGGLFTIEHATDLLHWDVIARDVVPQADGTLWRGDLPDGATNGFYRVTVPD